MLQPVQSHVTIKQWRLYELDKVSIAVKMNMYMWWSFCPMTVNSSLHRFLIPFLNLIQDTFFMVIANEEKIIYLNHSYHSSHLNSDAASLL